MRSCPDEEKRKRKRLPIEPQAAKKFYVDILRALTESIFLYDYQQVGRNFLFRACEERLKQSIQEENRNRETTLGIIMHPWSCASR